MYAFYARAFSPKTLTQLYSKIVEDNDIDAIISVDGGSDSLMRGDESGLGDPIEDAVSICTISNLQKLKFKALVVIGLGCDRFNSVTDASTLRAISEITKLGGFLGSTSLEPTGEGFIFYRDCLNYLYKSQTFRSVIAGSICAAAQGEYGSDTVPDELQGRVSKGQLFLWPLMAALWAFDPAVVAKRSLICGSIQHCETVAQCHEAFFFKRKQIQVRSLEDLPV
eukprot:TRINITY_DN52_c0_g6_i1.p1 TRINITY_DN52_c0_g6~~TRINITY_DN52_c0_g6_i1.p1  ORF type:complete len:224 (+),score=25.51 TRINITY_DN52_c0_g6_i1:369-1040(+)